jgi:hypothetical protein
MSKRCRWHQDHRRHENLKKLLWDGERHHIRLPDTPLASGKRNHPFAQPSAKSAGTQNGQSDGDPKGTWQDVLYLCRSLSPGNWVRSPGSIYISFSGAYQSNFYWEHCYILVMALFFTENNTTEYFVMTVIEILTLEDLQHS